MGILDSGILERLVRENFFGSDRSDIGSPVRVKKEDIPPGITIELLTKTGFVSKDFIKKNKEILQLTDEMINNAIVTYGPAIVGIIGALAGIWIAESQIKDFPPVLHTSMELLTQILRLTNVLSGFVAEGLGGITDFIKDPIGTITKPLEDILEPDPIKRQEVLKKNIEASKERRKEQVGIFARKGPG